MRVLQVLSTLNIGSGIAQFVVSYAKQLQGKDITFDYLIFRSVPTSFEQEVAQMGSKVFVVEQPTLRTASAYAKQVKEIFAQNQNVWDCVHIHEILVQRAIRKQAKKSGVKRVIAHSHNSRFVLPIAGYSPFKNWLYMTKKKMRNKFLLAGIKACDLWMACSQDAGKGLFGKKCVLSDKFFVVHNAVDGKRFAKDEQARRRLRLEWGWQDNKILLNVGRLSEQKNQEFLLDAFARVAERDGEYRLLIVGEGGLRKRLLKQAERLKIVDKVMFLGNRNDIPAVMQACDLFVLPSLTEGLGIVLIEAQASGLPCIASAGVPQEAKISPYLTYLPLSSGSLGWANAILETKPNRFDGWGYLNQSGYEIADNANLLASLYLTGKE